MGTPNRSLLSSATRGHSSSPSNCCFPTSPAGHSFPLTIWPQELRKDATGREGCACAQEDPAS